MRTRIIAEIGANHLGDMDLAKSMIDIAAASGADIVKFQSWLADDLIKTHPNYNEKYHFYLKSQLTDENHFELIDYCNKRGVEFMTSIFSISRINFLVSLGMKRIKVPSPELTSSRMLKILKESFEEIIVSTGMSEDREVIEAVEILKGSNFTLLHCVSLYPTPPERINLSRMNWLRSFTSSVGFSDHSMGVDAAKLAIGMGAKYIEKHFTIDRNLPGPDQKISCTPEELAEISRFARQAEIMRGDEHPELSVQEYNMRSIYIGKWGNNRE